ncbi:MAG: SDR family oxidoreductase [Nocardioides sp.]
MADGSRSVSTDHADTGTRVAVVTGAGRGIGRAVSLALADEGWTVVVAGRSPEPLADLAAAAPEGRVLPVPTDVTGEASVAALFEQVESTFGRVDLLFNNAGAFGRSAPITELSLAEWQATVEVNLTGSWLCARAAFALMQRQRPHGGRIINNGSISAQVPRPDSTPYAATKHAITGLTKALLLEGRAHDIAVCQIDIGNAATELTAGFSAGTKQANGSVLAEPTMDVSHVASTVVHMASLPAEANIPFVTVMATHMPLFGRG